MVASLVAQPPPHPGGSLDPLQQILQSLAGLATGFFAGLPRFLLAILVFALFWLSGKLLRRPLEPRLTSLRTPSFGRVFSFLAYLGVVFVGLLVALPIAFPSVSIAAVLGGLGLLGVAAGFALQDILSNLVAGILLIFRQPFISGDQIEVTGQEGTVEGISIRETRLRTYDGQFVIIPNKDVYTSTIRVQTHYPAVRSSLVVGVSYDTNLSKCRDVALRALADVDGVLADPPPQVYYFEFGGSGINLDLRYWTRPQQAEIRRVQDKVVEVIFDAFNAAGIDIPFTVVTLHASQDFEEILRKLQPGTAPS